MPPRLRQDLIPLLFSLFALVPLGCVSMSTAPPNLIPDECAFDSRLPGTWKSDRRSQLGPATMQFSFGCDCSYESRSRVFLFMSIRESGAYSAKNGQLSLSRAVGTVTTWPFRFDGDRLILEEFSNEAHDYRRTKQRPCPNASEQS